MNMPNEAGCLPAELRIGTETRRCVTSDGASRRCCEPGTW